jgi:hypothetical protein
MIGQDNFLMIYLMKEEEGRETELAIFFFPLVVGAFSGHRPTHNFGSLVNTLNICLLLMHNYCSFD